MTSNMIHRIFLGLTSAAVVVCALAGLWIAGSPAQERLRRLDDQRLMHLRQIESGVDQYWQQNNRLPQSLTDLERYGAYASLHDPARNAPYDYRPTSAETFQLCAVFDTDSTHTSPADHLYRAPLPMNQWDHHVGLTCFNLSVPAPYPKPAASASPPYPHP